MKLVNADEKTIPLSNEDDHGRMGIANDTMTLGNINLWNSHFVTIVNETQHISKLGYPFLSEKMWKPIIGMRPFLCLGDHGTIKLLQDAGFYTFNDMFDLAKKDLGVKFDVRKFHDLVLSEGAIPLNELDTLVENYIRLESEKD